MIQIRPTSDLQNAYNTIEKGVLENKQTIYLTKNGYGAMVIMSLDNYARLTDDKSYIPLELDTSKGEHVEIISRPKKIIDEDDE